MKAASIEFRQVTKRYGDVVAVNDVSFTIGAGTLVTLLGPSGCGKTTILRMHRRASSCRRAGTIRIGGEDVTARAAAERDVSMVFQSYALFPHMTVLENVRYGLVVSGKAQAAGRRAGTRRAGDRRPDRPRRAAALGALRRPAAARRRRARAGARARRCCCSTSRCRTSTRGCAGRCARRSANCSSAWTSPSSTSRTTRRRRWRCPTASS